MLAVLLLGSAAWASLAPQTGSKAGGRVIVLGFDGADARTTALLMDRGELPNLAALREQGSFSPLDTTNPAESPVSWAALNCGQNPAKTGVPGFIRRQFQTSPTKALNQTPIADFGHLVGPKQVPVESMHGAPIPTWSPNALGAALGAATLVLFLGVFLLLRMRAALAIALALIMGLGSFVGGRALRSYLPSAIPVWKNPLESVPFWETAAAAGVKCVVLDAAQSFDREPVDNAKVLAGLGVPDARGLVNSFFLYTTSEDYLRRAADGGKGTNSGGVVFRIDERGGRVDSLLPGPTNFWEIDRIRAELRDVEHQLDNENIRYKESTRLNKLLQEAKARLDEAVSQRINLPVVIERKGTKAAVTIGTETQELGAGAWSGWYHLSFELNPMLKVRALARAKLVRLDEGNLELYVDALQYDPAHPPFWQPISQPQDFAQQLEAASGPFETVGWACMNLPLKDGVIDSVSFMQDIEFTLEWRKKMTLDALEKNDWRVLMSCESTPDRVQHMMYQYYDPKHPMYSAEKAAQTMSFGGKTIPLSDAIPASYRSMDVLVGEVVKKHLKPEDTLIVCSDHGFQSFRRQVHLNNWLIEKGYAVLQQTIVRDDPNNPGDPADDLNRYIDWSKTRAYAMGLGMVYVNQRAREGQGIVPPEEARAVLDAIAKDFLDYKDVDTGELVGRGAYVMADLHKGAHLDREADMLLCFNAGYRVSWLTTQGGMSGDNDGNGGMKRLPTIIANDKNWSGDHVTVDPSLVQGIFFSNRKLAGQPDGINLLQIAPTVLKLLGVAAPAEYDMPAIELAR
ncbi:MAG TPA: alkaline phosphatase family protein [Planctomycetota bacterium]|nr:alkaline phosphatase family protein [Planctomycetota bacterium]